MLQVPRLIRWLGFLAVFFVGALTLLRLAVYVAFLRDTLPAGQAGPAFLLGLRYDLRVIAAGGLPLLLLGSIPLASPFKGPVRRRAWFGYFGVFVFGLVVFYLSDFLHLRYLGQRLNATALSFLGDAKISAEMVWQSYPVVKLLLAIALALGLIMAGIILLFRRAAANTSEPLRRYGVAWFIVVLLLCLVGIFGRLGQYPLRWSDAFSIGSSAAGQLALNPVEAFLNSYTFRTTGFDQARVEAAYPRMAAYLGATPDLQHLSYDRSFAQKPQATERRPNVILVICESFSAYKSSMWGNPLNTTPFFNELAGKGVFFDNCFTPHFGTARGVWATVTGTPDVSEVETASRNPSMVDQHTIIDDFEGYTKHYFIGGSSSWANIRGLLMNNIAGLHLHEEDSYSAPRVDVWGISDKNLFLEADKVLRAETGPFFAVIQTADNHRPYSIPKEDLAEFQKVDLPDSAWQSGGFESLAELNAFRYMDYTFRKFFEAAQKSPYFDNTIFVFVGDHGIGGNAGTMFPSAWTENRLTAFHVPLLFYAPQLLAPRRIHSVASQVDILPTLAGVANVAYRTRTFGRDLLRQEEIDGGASNRAFIIDHNDKTIGMVQNQHYGIQHADGRFELKWADFAAQPPATVGTRDSERIAYHTAANDFFETARFLLLNNHKTPAKLQPPSVHPYP
jgi:phosphoglycerol transferase MdoB-like AlkP superfamily enzyme